jgi:hypothetical protein
LRYLEMSSRERPPPLGYGEVTPEFAGMLRTTADVERVLGPGD